MMSGGWIEQLSGKLGRSGGKPRILRAWWLLPVVLGALAGLVFLLVVLLLRTPRDTVVLEIVPESDANTIEVWVGGAVAEPGLYQMERGSRVAEAIAMAGGTLPNAETDTIGMAARLEDADQIIVPERQPTSAAETGQPAPDSGSAGAVNVNIASQQELEALPHIGPVIATRIIEYRQQNGPFQSVDQLVNVSGISDRIVADLGDQITVGR